MKIIELSGTSDGSGDLTVTSSTKVTGYIERVVMDYDDGDTGADLTFTSENAVSQAILTITNAGVADKNWYPRTPTHEVADGSVFTYAVSKVYLANEALKVVVAQGGASKDFKFLIYVSDGDA